MIFGMSTEIHQNFGRRKFRNFQKKLQHQKESLKNSDQYRKDWLFQRPVLSKMSLNLGL